MTPAGSIWGDLLQAPAIPDPRSPIPGVPDPGFGTIGFPVTALTRRDVPVPLFLVTISNSISSVEWVALGVVNLQTTSTSRHARPRDVTVGHAEPDNDLSSSIYIRDVKLQDIRVVA